MKSTFLFFLLVFCFCDDFIYLNINSSANSHMEIGAVTAEMEVGQKGHPPKSLTLLVSTLSAYTWIMSTNCTDFACKNRRKLLFMETKCRSMEIWCTGLKVKGSVVKAVINFKKFSINLPILQALSIDSLNHILNFDGILGLAKDYTTLSKTHPFIVSVPEAILKESKDELLLYFNLREFRPYFSWINYTKETDSQVVWINFFDNESMLLVLKASKLVWLDNGGNVERVEYFGQQCITGCEFYLETAVYGTFAPKEFVSVQV